MAANSTSGDTGGSTRMGAMVSPVFKDIIVAVHGIGEQSRYSTVRSVATRLAGSRALRANSKSRPVAPQPLGYFHSDVRSFTSVRLLDDVDSLQGTDLASIGFAEVFWADIPQEVVKEGRTLEETKAWARTVVARANALCERARSSGRDWIVPPDFDLAGEVLDEIIETVYVLENLMFVATKAGFFTFDLRKVLEEYLGDVQLVAEFGYYRTDIVGRFHSALESIYEEQRKLGNPDARLHIVAHSEGTVVSFLGLLHAMSGRRVVPADAERHEEAKEEQTKTLQPWLKQVRGYMTIGSPIDKHLLLWPRLWQSFDPGLAAEKLPDRQIRWRNYYDYGDPVGFDLDTARLWLQQKKFTAFEFCGCKKCNHDVGFSRYLLPGEAHNQYWNDCDVFEHFISEAVRPNCSKVPPPRDKKPICWVSPILPYIVSLLLLAGGVFVLYKAVHSYTHPGFDPLQKFVRFTQLGIKPPESQSAWDLVAAVTGITALVAGATLFARFPRMAVGKRWLWLGMAAFVVGCVVYSVVVPRSIQHEIGASFKQLTKYFGDFAPVLGVLVLAACASLLGILLTGRFGNPDRGQRWLGRGIRPLMLCGALGVAGIVVFRLLPQPVSELKLTDAERARISPNQLRILREARLSDSELDQIKTARGETWMDTVEKVEPVLVTHPPAWPVVLSGAAFLYLWWLATLVFDLSFIWHRYVRNSVANDRLREWNSYDLSPRDDPKVGEVCCNPAPATPTSTS